MKPTTIIAAGLLLFGSQFLFAEDEPGAITPEAVTLDRPVDFQQDVLPMLQAKCLACHSASKKEGSLVLENVESILTGGDSGPAVVPGKPDESLLFTQATRQTESFMPPIPNGANAKPLTPHEAGLLKLWIEDGAKASMGTGAAIKWQALPDDLNPIYSLALTPNERYVAAGRGNDIVVYDILRQRQVTTLSDPELNGAAHRDFVHTLDFSPDGQWLASGGYRIVKLWQKAPPIEAQRPIDAPATLLTTSADGSLIATALPDGRIRLDARPEGVEPRYIEGHGAVATGLAFLPDGSSLLSASADNVRRWNVADGTLQGELKTSSPVLAVLSSTDCSQLITGHADALIRVWSIDQLTSAAPAEPAVPQVELKGHEKAVTALAWAVDGAPRLVSGSEDGSLRQWDIAAGTETRKLDHDAPITRLAATTDGTKLATLGGDHVARLWETTGNKLADLQGDPRLTDAVSLRKDDLTVATARKSLAEAAVKATEDDLKGREESLTKAREALTAAEKALEEAKAKVPEAEKAQATAKEALDAKPDDEGLKKAFTDAEAATKAAMDAVTKAEESVASAKRGIELSEKSIATAKAELDTRKQRQEAEVAAEKTAQEAVAAAEKLVADTPTSLREIAFTPDGSALATADATGVVTVWHVATQKPITVIPAESPLTTLNATNDQRLLSTTEDGRLLIMHVDPQWNLAGVLGPATDAENVSASLLEGRVLAIDFSPDGTRLAVGSGVPSRSGQLTIWNLADHTLALSIADAHSDTVFDVAFSRDGTQLASCGADKFAKVFDSATGELQNTFEGHTGHVEGVAWKADASQVATAGADNAIKIWNTSTSEQARTITSHSKPVVGLRYVGTTDNIVSAAGDKNVMLHTAGNGKNYRTFSGSTDFLHAVVVTRDESLVIAGGEDGIIRVWNGADGKLLTSFEPPAPASNEQAAR
ncbi:MAG: hypothetical protein KDA52_15780 [Planctomycetaceae bacterium]|nr:hypothetical protein [Planctomycetaceae bacterium]